MHCISAAAAHSSSALRCHFTTLITNSQLQLLPVAEVLVVLPVVEYYWYWQYNLYQYSTSTSTLPVQQDQHYHGTVPPYKSYPTTLVAVIRKIILIIVLVLLPSYHGSTFSKDQKKETMMQ
jgi:hypothetical protein